MHAMSRHTRRHFISVYWALSTLLCSMHVLAGSIFQHLTVSLDLGLKPLEVPPAIVTSIVHSPRWRPRAWLLFC